MADAGAARAGQRESGVINIMQKEKKFLSIIAPVPAWG
jgi:hypothetical protein